MSKTRVKRISVIQTSSVSAIIMLILSLILVIPIGWIMSSVGGFGFPGIHVTELAFVIFLPIIYGGLTFILTAICCLIYNMAAKWTGGIELELEIVDEEKV